MTRFTCARVGLAMLLALGATAARADNDPAPYETVRALETLQDRIAAGDAVSQVARAKAILRAGHAFAKAKPEVWGDRRNARALVVYLFSGGDAKSIGEAIPRSAIAPGVEGLYDGALAYGLGDDAAARAALMPIDAKAQSAGLGGHLALVQATLVANDDKAKAVALLDLARLLEPGSLIEEAALRKEMSLIGAGGDLDKFALLTRRYLGAFSHSSYADNFRQLVARTAMTLGANDTSEAGAKLARLMIGLDQLERRRLYLAIARAAVVTGRTTMATLASEEARKLAKADEPDAARAMVYFGAATIVSARYDLGKAALTDAAVDRLSPTDRALRVSALSVAETIRRPLGDEPATQAQAEEATVAAEAARALEEADAALGATAK